MWYVTYTATKNTETLSEASTEVGLQANTENTKYLAVSRHSNVGQNHSLLIANKYSENVANLKYLETNIEH
jgi:hypothetical protein